MTEFWKYLQKCACPASERPAAFGDWVCTDCLQTALHELLKTPNDVDGPKPESGNLAAYRQGWKNAFDFLREQVKE
jgi:hypothetical protein